MSYGKAHARGKGRGYWKPRALRFAKKLRERKRHKRLWNRVKMQKRSRAVNRYKSGQRRKR